MLKVTNSNSYIIGIILISLFSNVYAFCGQNSTETTLPLNVYVVDELFDDRPFEDKEQIELQKNVSKKIPRMLINQIYSRKIFEKATLFSSPSKYVSNAKLDSLRKKGVDAVIVGNIIYSNKYHKSNIGRMMLYAVPLGVISAIILNFTVERSSGYTIYYWYGPGVALGVYLESALHKEYDMEFVVKMVSTSTYDILHEDVYKIHLKKIIGQKTFELPTEPLRDLINEMVEELSKVSVIPLFNSEF